jgi:hypothetical protein
MNRVRGGLPAWLRSFHLIFLVFIILIAKWGVNATTTDRSEGRGKPEVPGVKTLLQAGFYRVPGNAYGGAVLDIGEAGSWYSQEVWGPTVDFDGQVYRLWFIGGAKTVEPGVPYGLNERIGLAESRDGVNWKLANGGKPVLSPGPPGEFDSKGVSHPYVLRIGRNYIMWYAGIDGKLAKDLGLAPGKVRIERIGLATSSDGIHWKRANNGKPVLDIGPKDSIDSIQATGMHVQQISNRFVMWYGAYNGVHTLAMAMSPDGIHWEKVNGGKALTGLAGPGQLGPSVYFDGREYFMLYNSYLNQQWATFAASSSDGVHWHQAFRDKPVLGLPPASNFGTAGPGRNHSVLPSQIIIQGRRIRVWYAAEDSSPPYHQRIGLMEATLP